MQLVDSSRSDPYAANGTLRELLVRFWYPASLEQGCKSAEYTSPRVWSYLSELIAVHLPEVSTNSCLDAVVTEGQHPIVVFTHGYTGTFTDYTYLFEDLASRGYIVASVDHTYEATAVEFPVGRFVESIPCSYFARIAGNNEHELALAVDVGLRDLRFTADELEVLNTAVGGPHMAIAGHSLGGLTAFLSLEQEPRFKAAIILDGVVPEDVVAGAESPILMLTMGHSRNDWSSSERRLWSELHGPHFLANLQGAEHLTPTDLVWLAKGAIRTGTMGPDKTIAAIRDYSAAFLDVSLRGQLQDPLLNRASGEFPDVELIAPIQPLPQK